MEERPEPKKENPQYMKDFKSERRHYFTLQALFSMAGIGLTSYLQQQCILPDGDFVQIMGGAVTALIPNIYLGRKLATLDLERVKIASEAEDYKNAVVLAKYAAAHGDMTTRTAAKQIILSLKQYL
jgi:hypothetical protein